MIGRRRWRHEKVIIESIKLEIVASNKLATVCGINGGQHAAAVAGKTEATPRMTGSMTGSSSQQQSRKNAIF